MIETKYRQSPNSSGLSGHVGAVHDVASSSRDGDPRPNAFTRIVWRAVGSGGLDVGVAVEQILGVVLSLDFGQPLVFRGAVGSADAIVIELGYRIDVHAKSLGVRAQRLTERTCPRALGG
jgi:hypothetical protein